MTALSDFIAAARQDSQLQQELQGCSLESWGDGYTPLDIDENRVIEVAQRAGFAISRQDIIKAQCEHLDKFWRFEMENSFVARRYLARVQYHLSTSIPDIDYYSDP